MADNETTHQVFQSEFQVNTDQAMVKVDDLETDRLYSFYVVSRNKKGTSLPSSILTVNISLAAWSGQTVGATSPPHVLRLRSRTESSLSLEWNPPSIAHPESQIQYRLYYRPVSNETHTDLQSSLQYEETDLLSLTLESLQPDTEYELSVTALTSQLGQNVTVESRRSETLQTWTLALIPPFVQIRLVKDLLVSGERKRIPSRKVVEGGNITVLCLATGQSRH